MSSINKTVFFGEKAAGVYLLTDIYDPDTDSPDLLNNAGKIVPAVGSLVIDNTRGNHTMQYTVVSVNPETYKATLMPSSISATLDSSPDRVLNYGSDLLMLYFMRADKPAMGNRLIVDNKLSLFGNFAATYILTMDTDAGHVTISRWYKPDGTEAGVAVPMLETGIDGVRKCDGCYTNYNLHEGDSVTCEIYNSAGILIAAINLIAKQAHLLNEVASAANPIVELRIEANQQLGPNEFYLYQGQEPSALTFFPKLIYADGTHKSYEWDGNKAFCYGLEDINTDLPEQTFPLLFKYYLGDDDVNTSEQVKFVYFRTEDTTAQADKTYYVRTAGWDRWEYTVATVTAGQRLDDHLTDYFERKQVPIDMTYPSDAVKFISVQGAVRILTGDPMAVTSKIAFIPYLNSDNLWRFKYLFYKQSMAESPVVLSYTEANAQLGMSPAFNYTAYNTKQNKTITYKDRVATVQLSRSQPVCLELRNPTNWNETNPVAWIMATSETADRKYGEDTQDHPRPRMYYSTTNQTLQIPADIFTPTLSIPTAKDRVMDCFYWQADPPMINGVRYTPNGFILRRVSDGKKISGLEPIMDTQWLNPIPVDHQPNGVVIVEFVQVVQKTTSTGATYQVANVLYGVPVDVYNRT